jgi:hypothetical protein
MGKKDGKRIVKPSDGFGSVAYKQLVPGFTNRKDRQKQKRGSEGK